jgi:hypothetical protein
MRATENMDNSEILSHFLRKDLPSGKPLTGSIHGVMAVSSKIAGNYPLLVDMTASYDREQGTTGQDFDKSRGSIDIGPSIEVARKKMAHILVDRMCSRMSWNTFVTTETGSLTN